MVEASTQRWSAFKAWALLGLTACQGPNLVSTAPGEEIVVLGATMAPSGTGLIAQKRMAEVPGNSLRLDRQGQLASLRLKQRILEQDPVQRTQEVAVSLKEALLIDDPQDLQIERNDQRAQHQRLRLRQLHRGVPLDDVRIDLHFREGSAQDTELHYITGAGVPNQFIVESESDLTEGMAKQKARILLGRSELAWELTPQLVYRKTETTYELAWRIEAVSAVGPFAETLWLKADQTGMLVERVNRIRQDSAEALIHRINPSAGPREWTGLPHLSLTNAAGQVLGTTDRNGNHSVGGSITLNSLMGPFAAVESPRENNFSYSGSANARIQLAANDPNISELSAFYFINQAHDWFKDRHGFSGLDRPIQVIVHEEDCLFNAYAYNDTRIGFGNGCGIYDFAQTADVAFHEYAHSVVHNIADLDYSPYTEAGAYNEGNADYFSCTMTNDPNHGENMTGVFTRRCDSNDRVDRDYNGEAHSGATIYSGIMWKLRTQFGAAIADQLAFTTMSYLPRKPYFLDVRDAVLEADEELYGLSHRDAIMAAFAAHGINDEAQVFVATDQWQPKSAPFVVNLTAHAQGFNTQSLNFNWEFGDGSTDQGEYVEHQFTKKPYTAKVTASDDSGLSRFHEVTFNGCSSAGNPSAFGLILAVIAIRRLRRSTTPRD